jgi:hypothetical protein
MLVQAKSATIQRSACASYRATGSPLLLVSQAVPVPAPLHRLLKVKAVSCVPVLLKMPIEVLTTWT